MWNCRHCKREFKDLSSSEKANHSRWCNENSKREIYLKTLEKTRNNISPESRKRQGVLIKKARIEGKYDHVNFSFSGWHHTEECKQRMSVSKKKWMIENPENHIWNFSKNKSIPCEFLKEKLKIEGIEFQEEYKPLFPKRFFSIDIVFLDKKIGVEINGNQHYNKNKTLKLYYQERHDLIEKEGWKLIELHYLDVYKENIIEIIKEIIA